MTRTVVGVLLFASVSLWAADVPASSPGPAKARLTAAELVLENDALVARWTISQGRLGGLNMAHRASGRKLLPAEGELLKIRLTDGRTLKASSLRVQETPVLRRIEPWPDAVPRCQRQAGWKASAMLAAEDGTRIQWQAILRDGAHYVRQEVRLIAGPEGCTADGLALLDCQLQGAQVAGSVDGSPILAGPFFLACEHPMSTSRVEATGPRARWGSSRNSAPTPTVPGVAWLA